MHTFMASGELVFLRKPAAGTVEVLVVGGGGGAGVSAYKVYGAAGGAGGYGYHPSFDFGGINYVPVAVGRGGGGSSSRRGNNGGDSKFGSDNVYILAYGGGGGGGYLDNNGYDYSNQGGSGGAGAHDSSGTGGDKALRGVVVPSSEKADIFGHPGAGAGSKGGGAGGPGSGDTGGPGVESDISGKQVTYAAGGGNDSGLEADNTGNGSGGCYNGNGGDSGGSGIVIVRWPYSP